MASGYQFGLFNQSHCINGKNEQGHPDQPSRDHLWHRWRSRKAYSYASNGTLFPKVHYFWPGPIECHLGCTLYLAGSLSIFSVHSYSMQNCILLPLKMSMCNLYVQFNLIAGDQHDNMKVKRVQSTLYVDLNYILYFSITSHTACSHHCLLMKTGYFHVVMLVIVYKMELNIQLHIFKGRS